MTDPLGNAVVEIWSGPIPMEPGAPEPVLVRDDGTAWVAYRAIDPNFPGWEHPDVTEYLDANPGELFGVLRFDEVVNLSIGPPSDERLNQHPLFGRGLKYYEFHRLMLADGQPQRWIVTFHDETLEAEASRADFVSVGFSQCAEEAIAKARALDNRAPNPAGLLPVG
jgi:hypothetical protein